MPTLRYALERGAPPRLTVRWDPFRSTAEFWLDGAPLGRVDGRRVLQAGQTLALPDGSSLWVQQALLGADLHLACDGRPLHEAAGGPETLLALASGAVLVAAGMMALVSSPTRWPTMSAVQSLTMAMPPLLFGIFFLVLACKLLRAWWALVAAEALLAADTVAAASLSAQAGLPASAVVLPRLATMVLIALSIGLPGLAGWARAGGKGATR
ncbi:MAG: hypothetical protein ACUVX9_05815 [Anaerolineae bacterium]